MSACNTEKVDQVLIRLENLLTIKKMFCPKTILNREKSWKGSNFFFLQDFETGQHLDLNVSQ